jgi:uncharacterized membrane protein
MPRVSPSTAKAEDPMATQAALPPMPRSILGRIFIGRRRLIAAVVCTVVAYLIMPESWTGATRNLIAWNAGALLYIASTVIAIASATTRTIRWRAAITDEGRFTILILVSIAALAALGAIFAQLTITKDLHGAEKGMHLALAALTIITAWFFIHLSYALHYAHEYFDETKTCEGEQPVLKGGVAFPGTDEPDYWDFLYFSFIIGVASQTADVAITSKAIRRTSLAHSILAFFFNSAVLALTINIASSLV